MASVLEDFVFVTWAGKDEAVKLKVIPFISWLK